MQKYRDLLLIINSYLLKFILFMFNIIIIGGENCEDYKKFQDKCIFYLQPKVKQGERIRILTTGDEYVKRFSECFGINTKTFPCQWEIYGKEACKYRNHEMIKEADAMIYFRFKKRKDLDTLFRYAISKNINTKLIH